MKTLLLITFFLAFINICNAQIDSLYLGQKPPGDVPEIFDPERVSVSDRNEYCPVFSPDGKAFYFTVTDEINWNPAYIMVSRFTEGSWTDPEILDLPGKDLDWGNCFSADGNTMIFNSANSDWDIDMYSVTKSGDSWIDGAPLSSTINEVGSAIATSIADDGTLYFRSSVGDYTQGINEIFYSPLEDGAYDTLYAMEMPVNTKYPEDYPSISPDKSFLIFYRNATSSSRGVYVSFNMNDRWTNPKNMELELSGSQPGGGSISPDGKYFFYQGPGKDIYWVALEGKLDSLKNSNYAPYVMIPIKDTVTDIDQNYSFTLPDSMFIDDDGNETLTISASLNDDSALPGFLNFDPQTKTLSGILSESGSYDIKLTATDTAEASTSDVFKLTVNRSTSLNGLETTDSFLVFPNPASASIHLKANSTTDFETYQIVDLCGKIVMQGALESEIIDVSELSKGIYVITIQSSQNILSRKIIIE